MIGLKMDCFASLAMTILHACDPLSDGMSSMKSPAVYIMASLRNGTLYTGVTSDLPRRAFEHREGLIEGFTKKYNCKLLVWYEVHETMEAAILREKQIKAGSRKDKIQLIQKLNPAWDDLYDALI